LSDVKTKIVRSVEAQLFDQVDDAADLESIRVIIAAYAARGVRCGR
jgi:hypothetical protein